MVARETKETKTGTSDLEPTPVEWFVAEMAADLGLGDRAVDRRCGRILSRLTRWATVEGIPSDREIILRPGHRRTVRQVALEAAAGIEPPWGALQAPAKPLDQAALPY